MGADMDIQWTKDIDKPKNGFDVTLHTEPVDQGTTVAWRRFR